MEQQTDDLAVLLNTCGGKNAKFVLRVALKERVMGSSSGEPVCAQVMSCIAKK